MDFNTFNLIYGDGILSQYKQEIKKAKEEGNKEKLNELLDSVNQQIEKRENADVGGKFNLNAFMDLKKELEDELRYFLFKKKLKEYSIKLKTKWEYYRKKYGDLSLIGLVIAVLTLIVAVLAYLKP